MLATPLRDDQGHVSWPDMFCCTCLWARRLKQPVRGGKGANPVHRASTGNTTQRPPAKRSFAQI